MRILIATGGSSHSDTAVRFGGLLAAQLPDTTVTLLMVIKKPGRRAKAEAVLGRARRLLGPDVQRVQERVRRGHPAEEIIREAEEGEYDLVIVGERQHHDVMTRFILGATAERVVEHAPCPVIVAKGKVSPVQHILLCDSGYQASSLADRFLEQLRVLITGREEITILHVMSHITAGPGVRGKELRASAAELIAAGTPEGQLLERARQTLSILKVKLRPEIRHGFVVDEILEEARSGDYDLVVIGTHQGSGWRRILLDDLAHQIIVQIDRPILVVR